MTWCKTICFGVYRCCARAQGLDEPWRCSPSLSAKSIEAPPKLPRFPTAKFCRARPDYIIMLPLPSLEVGKTTYSTTVHIYYTLLHRCQRMYNQMDTLHTQALHERFCCAKPPDEPSSDLQDTCPSAKRAGQAWPHHAAQSWRSMPHPMADHAR
jgi:hypothetical protein